MSGVHELSLLLFVLYHFSRRPHVACEIEQADLVSLGENMVSSTTTGKTTDFPRTELPCSEIRILRLAKAWR